MDLLEGVSLKAVHEAAAILAVSLHVAALVHHVLVHPALRLLRPPDPDHDHHRDRAHAHCRVLDPVLGLALFDRLLSQDHPLLGRDHL